MSDLLQRYKDAQRRIGELEDELKKAAEEELNLTEFIAEFVNQGREILRENNEGDE